MNQSGKAESLKQWCLNHIDNFRKEYEKLTPDEQKGMNHRNNFLDPCQLEIFWITNPDYQLVVRSNCNDRRDRQVTIHGPYQPHEFRSNATTILEEKWWTRDLGDSSEVACEQVHTVGEAMADEVYKFIEMAKSHLFQSRQDARHVLYGVLVGDAWAHMHAGNIGDLDYVQEVDSTIQEIKRASKAKQEQKPCSQQPRSFTDEVYLGFGAHFFPPIMLGKKRKPTIEQRIHNPPTTWMYNDMAFDMMVGDHKVIVNDDGLVFVETKDKDWALKILNLVMACSVFYHLNSHAVHERELVMSDYDEQNLTLTSMQWDTETRRTPLLEDRFNPRSTNLQRIQVRPETIREILSNAGKLLAHNELATDLRLFNEGLTHFENSEFDQSFVMGWTVIERHYSSMWEILRSMNVTGRLNKSHPRTFDGILKSLNRQGEIDKHAYDRLMDLKGKRNKFHHRGRSITKDSTEHCIKYAMRLIYDKVVPLISISDDFILPGRQNTIKYEDCW